MPYTYKNIRGTNGLTQLVLPKTATTIQGAQAVEYMYITNLTDDRSFNIGLILKSKENTYYLFNNFTLPVGTTLKLDEEDMGYDNVTYDLYIKLNNIRDNVDIKIKTKL